MLVVSSAMDAAAPMIGNMTHDNDNDDNDNDRQQQ
jgi:hypothetical protein